MNLVFSNSSQWHSIARKAWPVLALLAVAVLIASLPGYDQRTLGATSSGSISDSTSLETSLNIINIVASLIAAVVSLGLAALLYWRKRDDRMALFLTYFFVLYGVIMAGPLETLELVLDTPFSGSVALLLQPTLMTMILVILYTFPDGRFVPNRTRWLIPIAIGFTPILIVTTLAIERTLPGIWLLAVSIILLFLIGAGFYGQIIRYRYISSPRQRLQTKWVVYGMGLWIIVVVISSGPYIYQTTLPPDAPSSILLVLFSPLWWLGLTIMPITFTIAVLRHRLWEIDLLINRTLVYALSTGLLVATYLVSVVLLQAIFTVISGQQSPIAIVISTLIIAALFNPLRQRVQAFIDRRFYRSKYDAAQTLARFAQKARDEVEIDALTAELVRVVQQTMQPEGVDIWLRPIARKEKS